MWRIQNFIERRETLEKMDAKCQGALASGGPSEQLSSKYTVADTAFHGAKRDT